MPEPPSRARLLGQFFVQCPTCRTHRNLGRDCCGGRVRAKTRRQRERREIRRWWTREGVDR